METASINIIVSGVMYWAYTLKKIYTHRYTITKAFGDNKKVPPKAIHRDICLTFIFTMYIYTS